MVPMNFLKNKDSSCDYLDVGQWSIKAIKEAKKYGNVNVAASSADVSYKKYPHPNIWNNRADSDYLHLVMN